MTNISNCFPSYLLSYNFMSKNETPQILIYLANIYCPVEVIDTE